jgi:hypothetical protein
MENTTVFYALFNAHPATNPPFVVELGTGKNSFFELKDCQHVPDAIAKIETFCKEKSLDLSPDFTLIYPIYLDAMDSDCEGTMHQIAWLIKEQSDAKGWKFDRIGGYTGMTTMNFVP